MIYALILIIVFVLGIYGVLLGQNYADFPYLLAGRKVTTAFGTIFILVSLETTGIWMFFRTPTPQMAMVQSETYSVAYIVSTVMQAQLKFPVRVNENVQLEAIRSHQNRLVYVMSIRAPDSAEFLRIVSAVGDDMKKNGCQREDYQTLMKYGLGIEIDFKVLGAWGADPLMLTSEMCGL